MKKIKKLVNELEVLNAKKPRKEKLQRRTGKIELTEKEIRETIRENDNNQLILTIQDYIFQKKHNQKPSLELFASKAGIDKRTFKKRASEYKAFGKLKNHGNKGKAPHNKISSKDIEKMLNLFDKMLLKIERHHRSTVPMTIQALYFFLIDEYEELGIPFPIKQSSFYNFVTRKYRLYFSNYSDKSTRQLIKKIIRLKHKIKAMQEAFKKAKRNLESETITNEVFAPSESITAKYKPSPLRSVGRPGECIMWDGSMDYYHNGKTVTRMHAIDQKTLYTMGLSFVKNENNKGYKNLINTITKAGIPNVIKCDKRKGVDPKDEGALIAIICKFLGITLIADSNSTHKADIEKMNGNMHALIAGYCALNKITSISDLQKQTNEITTLTNRYFNYPKPDFSHLRQLSKKQRKFFSKDLVQLKIMALDGIVYGNSAYVAIDSKGKEIMLPRFTWSLIAVDDDIPRQIHTDNGIFKLIRINKELKASSVLALSKSWEAREKHFINNSVMIANRETIATLIKEARGQGFRDANRHKIWKLNEQVKRLIYKKRKISQEIEELNS